MASRRRLARRAAVKRIAAPPDGSEALGSSRRGRLREGRLVHWISGGSGRSRQNGALRQGGSVVGSKPRDKECGSHLSARAAPQHTSQLTPFQTALLPPMRTQEPAASPWHRPVVRAVLGGLSSTGSPIKDEPRRGQHPFWPLPICGASMWTQNSRIASGRAMSWVRPGALLQAFIVGSRPRGRAWLLRISERGSFRKLGRLWRLGV